MTVFNDMKIQQAVTTKPVEQASTDVKSIPVATQAIEKSIPAVPQVDTLEVTTQPKEKKGPVKAVKGFIANVKKFFATTGAYIAGTFKGITSGAIAGSVVFTGATLVNTVKQKKYDKLVKIATEKQTDLPKKLKKLPAKPLAILAGAVALGAGLWNASLNATEKQSEIEHRWTGH